MAIGLLVTLIAAPVVVALAGRTPNILEQPIFPDEPRDLPHYHVELAYDAPPVRRGNNTARLRLDLVDPSLLVPHEQIRILMGTFDTRPVLVDGQLTVVGTDCVYRTPPDAVLADNDVLPFARSSGCLPFRGSPTGRLDLELTFRGLGRVGVLARLPPHPATDATTIYVPARQARAPYRPALLGAYSLTAGRDRTRRIDLLNYTWQLTASPWWIWTVLAGALLLVLAGIRIFPWSAAQDAAAPVAAGLAAGCFACALALAYVVLVPPFQAPDEPDHLLAYAAVTGRPELVPAIEGWARLTHFERIRFHWLQKFRAGNIGRPYPVPWADDVWAEDVRARSVTAYRLWTSLGRIIPRAGPQATLLILRIVNALIFGAAVGLACGFVVWCAGTSTAHLAWFPFLLVPTLPFLAMHLSEFASLTSTYVLAAAAALVVFLGGPRSHYAGLMLGLSGAVLLTSGRSAIPFSAVLAAVILGRAVVGQSGGTGQTRGARYPAIFWGGLAAGVLALWLLSTANYLQLLAKLVHGAAASLGPLGDAARLADTATSGSLFLVGGLLVTSCGFAAEILAGVLRRRIPHGMLRGAARIVACGAAIVIVGLMLASLRQALPHAIDRPALASDYVSDVLWTFGTGLRLHDPDVYLSSSFWVGFGWLDTMPPPALVVALTTMTGLAFVAMLWKLGEERDAGRVLLLGIYAVGWCTSLALYAASAHSLYRVLTGRYLVGLYLSMLAIAWSGPLLFATAVPADNSKPHWRQAASGPAVLLTLCCVIHAYCLSFIVTRYF